MCEYVIRAAEAEDAEAVGRLAGEFVAYLRALGDEAELRFDATTYLRDGFGDNPAFSGLVAVRGAEVLGYLLYHQGYDADYAARTLHVADLYVSATRRGHGIGRALMERACEICRRFGGTQVVWSVYAPNQTARGFYERLGARYTRNMLFMRLDV